MPSSRGKLELLHRLQTIWNSIGFILFMSRQLPQRPYEKDAQVEQLTATFHDMRTHDSQLMSS
jgi:hypothetical protein